MRKALPWRGGSQGSALRFSPKAGGSGVGASRGPHAACPGGRGARAGRERAERCPAPLPAPRGPPTSSEHAGCQGAARGGRAVQAPRRVWEAAALARRPRRSAPGTRRRAAGHGPAPGPPGGLGAQPLARYVPFLPPTPPHPGLPEPLPGAPGPRILLPGAGRGAPPGSHRGYSWGRGAPGAGCRRADGPSSAQAGGPRKRLGAGVCGVWGELKRLQLESVEGWWPHRTPWLPPGATPASCASRARQGLPARAGKGMRRAKRALPCCPAARSGGRTLRSGEPGAADPEGWGHREPRASQSPSGPGRSASQGCGPLASEEPSTAGPGTVVSQSRDPGNVIRHSG